MKIQGLVKELGYTPFGWYEHENYFTATVYVTEVSCLLKQLSLLIVEKLDMKIISLLQAKELINSMFSYVVPMEGTIIFINERWEE